MNRLQRHTLYGLMLALFALLAGALSLIITMDQKAAHNLRTDMMLEQAVSSISAVVPDGVHIAAMQERPMDVLTEKDLAMALGELAASLDVAYLYTLVRLGNGDIRFVISSPTPEESSGADPYASAYLTPYPELAARIAPLFDQDQDLIIEHEDRWGQFRTLFRPVMTATGKRYLLAADLRLDDVQASIRTTLYKTIGLIAMLFLVSVPLLVLVHRARQREMKARMRGLLCDDLTGLPNRRSLGKHLKQCQDPHLIILNVLRFRDINNAYGQAHGDLILSKFARHLSVFSHPLLNPHRTYRLHGDEFALLIDQPSLPEDMNRIFSTFLSHVSAFRYKVSEEDIVRLHVAIGAVTESSFDCMTQARIALHAAIDSGKSLVVYDDSLPQAERFQDNLRQLKLLGQAFDEDRLVPWFQPIYDLETMAIRRYEALARIVDENGVIVSMPHDFIPVAHRYHLYYKITRRIVAKTLAWLNGNQAHVSINLSIRDIEHQPTRETIIRQIVASGHGPRVSFELLESDAINELDSVLKFFARLKTLGCRVGIDDLGKEYSNFDRLTSLKLDFIKLDGAVIRHLDSDPESFEVIRTVVELAQERGLTVTAEYLSCATYLELARSLGCDLGQGYHLAEPGPDVRHDHAPDQVSAH